MWGCWRGVWDVSHGFGQVVRREDKEEGGNGC
jgi:hypothetical protein